MSAESLKNASGLLRMAAVALLPIRYNLMKVGGGMSWVGFDLLRMGLGGWGVRDGKEGSEGRGAGDGFE